MTEQEKRILSQWNAEKYFPQLDLCIKKCKLFEITPNGDILLTKEKAIELLGLEGYLSGIDRACFHRTAVRDNIHFVFDYSDKYTNLFLKGVWYDK